jgi:hypothetical protein
LGALELGLVQAIDESLVFEDITFGVGKFLKQLLFVARQLDLETLLLFKQLSLSALELRLLEVDCDGEELALETTLRHREVDVCDKSLRIWRDLYELISGCQIELECWVVIDRLVANLHDLSRSLLVEVLSKDWEEKGFDPVDLLDDEDLSKSDGQLENRVELLVLVIEDFHALFALLQ